MTPDELFQVSQQKPRHKCFCIRFTDAEYKALCGLAKRLKIRPTDAVRAAIALLMSQK